jgi:AraC family transcriptional regulator
MSTESEEYTCLHFLNRQSPFGSLAAAEVAMWPGVHTEPYQDAVELCLVIDGTYEQRFRSQTRTLSTSTVRIAPPSSPGRMVFGPEGSRCFFLSYASLERSDRRFLTPRRHVFLQDPESRTLAWKAYAAFHTGGEAPLVLDTLGLELFARAARSPSLPGGPPPAWLCRARDWLHDCFDEPLGLADAALEAGITPVHLSRAFRLQFGCTMGAYLRAVRVAYVREALAGPEPSLARIAQNAGFFDQSHMTRAFKRAYGTTPGAYRRALGSSTRRADPHTAFPASG